MTTKGAKCWSITRVGRNTLGARTYATCMNWLSSQCHVILHIQKSTLCALIRRVKRYNSNHDYLTFRF